MAVIMAGQLQKKSAATAATCVVTRKIPVPQFPLRQLTWRLAGVASRSAFNFIGNPLTITRYKRSRPNALPIYLR